ncbi:MAG: heme lyase CcmF/NrfE family subunit, partial [Myxococcales bacterium]|nr:heme lyase CcmF/NrfE family subunit [Myxococcales bacterium]
MQDLGQLLLVVAFFMTLVTALTAILGAITRDDRLMRGARSGLYATTLVCLAMAVVLTHGFVTHAFDNKYVATYSDREMPIVYLIASFWGGEKGALLFWVTSLSVFSSVAIYTKRERSPVYLSWVVAILSLAILFFFILMVFETSPFETFMTSRGPDDGRGLNPLLQNPVMAFHPPSLLTGYILFTIPFAFGMAALITKKLDDQWITDTRRWTIVSWTFLTIGLLLGARWAYMEIGWGFWWMWDSVENAGFIPWFTATAFLHSVMIQERRGMLKRWNVILLAYTFMLTIFGTFLTRSQLIVSIHSFADSVLPNYFFTYLIIIAVVAGGLIIWRWSALKSEARIESVLSRESAFVLNNVILVFCSFVVIWGTLMGKITESPAVRSVLGLDEPQVWDESKFNEIFVPIGIALLLLMAVGPLVSWRRATAKNFRKNIAWPLALGAITTLVIGTIAIVMKINDLAALYSVDFGRAYEIWASRYDAGDVLSVVVYFLSAVTLFGIFREFHLGAMVRRAKQAGGYLVQLVALTVKNPRRYGGYLVHIGVVFLFIAFTGKAFQTEEKDRLVTLGNVHSVDDYSLALVDRDRFWNDEESCVSTTATFIVMPLGSTVAEREI